MRWIISHPGRAAALVGKKTLLLINAQEGRNNINPRWLADEDGVLLLARWWPATWLLLSPALLGLGYFRRWKPGGSLLLWVIVLQAAAVLPFFVNARFRLPLLPLLALFAAAGVAILVENWTTKRSYDLAYAYYLRSAEALRPATMSVPVSFLALQLSQTLNTERLGRNAKSIHERLFYRHESNRLGTYEAKIWQIASRTVLIGEKDADAIRTVCTKHGEPSINNIVFGPHGVDIKQFAPRTGIAVDPDLIVMSGVMRYAPNVGAALWFIREVWPRLRAVSPTARFCLVGRDPEPSLLEYHDKDGIEVTGTVEDPAEWIARAAICVAPIQAAAGLQNKLLEAMAMAKPVVATTVANEGIAAVPNRDILIADQPDGMATALANLLMDPNARASLGASARTFIERHWTWEGPFLKLEQAIFDTQDEKDTARLGG